MIGRIALGAGAAAAAEIGLADWIAAVVAEIDRAPGPVVVEWMVVQPPVPVSETWISYALA